MSVRSVLVNGIGGLLVQQAAQATSRDVLVAITSKTDSSDVAQIVRESKRRGVRTIVLADSRVNPLTKHADVMLEAPEVQPLRSLAVPMTLALALVVWLGRRIELQPESTKAVSVGRLRR
jgi:DNA-binding MurR/RpiR family transcriptional regulator